ncbi:HK97 family phage prohead protease [Pseudophaeobacter flagellatus]|uniref:HK97 family phage prohead protease n=1 Tax=Pseudophaeobacter flagellatus TaxID=2899119 RepID=UPI001E5451DD|nr:HK97 family phage prohead protease [Pseudophaeobacter flagellatus]MCD9147686.1 HK97 family phage prohead protease [Pseudophaeobacter flagellatus]
MLKVQDNSVIQGYASLFGAVDQGGDVVAAGAYGASISALEASGSRVKMLWQHDPMQPIGVWEELREDSRGLWVKGRLLTEIARGGEAAALIAAGAIEGLSIGYRTKRARQGDSGRRVLTEVELWEVSLVTFPMLPTARIAPQDCAPVTAKQSDAPDQNLRALAADLRRASRQLSRAKLSHHQTRQDSK